MEKLLEQTLLYDFYGELLNENQRRVYEDVVLNDYSLSEIANERGISRQGVHDMIRRCNKSLQDYEDRLHLVDKFIHIKKGLNQIQRLTENCDHESEESVLMKISVLTAEILEEL